MMVSITPISPAPPPQANPFPSHQSFRSFAGWRDPRLAKAALRCVMTVAVEPTASTLDRLATLGSTPTPQPSPLAASA